MMNSNSGSIKRLLVISMLAALPVTASAQSTSDARQLDKAEIRQITRELQSVSGELDALLAMNAGGEASSVAEVTVVKGDCLSALAKKHLGSASRWPELVKWNQDRYPSLLKNPDLIHIGWKLRMAPPSAAKPNTNAAQSTTPATSATSGSSTTAATSSGNAAPPAATNTDEPVITIPSSTPPTTGSTTPPAVATTPQEPETKPWQSLNPDFRYGSSMTHRAVPDGVPIIKSDSRVLHIGDSHTCGTYGKAIDACMRESGATVSTYGVSGSSPSWWFNGTVGKSGYFAKDESGKVDQPADWRTPRATPKLVDLIKEKKPTVLVVSLGANLIGGSNAAIQGQVKSICEVAKQNGTQLVWVGPPDGRSKSSSDQTRLYLNLKTAVDMYGGTFIDSRPFTEYPATGGDGVHYGGSEGNKIANDWAKSTYKVIQGEKP
ncbi:MAG: hypothetical protein GQF41_1910 [Candidatus Rifleibacterium amylolyticum]|nr:MAG: hypothetical protein GQF41_1910 [Candidatus Rifleibacterium amylolyticum]